MKFRLLLLVLALFSLFEFVVNVEQKSNQRLFNRLTKQLSKVKGFKTCNLYVDYQVKSSPVVDMLQAQLSKRFQIVSLGKKSLQLWKFKRTDFTKMIRWKKREQKNLMISASGNSILIAVVDGTRNDASFVRDVEMVFKTLALRSSIPKLLVISLTNKKQAYKKVFRYFASLKIIDVDVLEISMSSRKLRAGKRVGGFSGGESINFTVHKCNPFKKNCFKKQTLKRNAEWFEPKVKNCNGVQLKIHPYSKGVLVTETIWGGKKVTWHYYGPKSAVACHFVTSMNVSFARARSKAEFDVFLENHALARYFLAYPFLKPIELVKWEFYTPVIHDSKLSFNIDYLFFYFAAVLLTLLLLQVCCILGHFDRRTWSAYEVVKMLFGFPNPRYPKLLVESALFCLISLGGICITNFVSEAMTGMMVPVEEERLFNTFEDLRDSNVTLYLNSEPATVNKLLGIKYENAIIKSGVRYQVESNPITRQVSLMRKMVNSKNMSISGFANHDFSMYPPKVVIDGKLVARRSDLTEQWALYSYFVRSFSPYYERMSDLYWRFLECGFTVDSKTVIQYLLFDTEEKLHKSVWENQKPEGDSESIDDVTCLVLLYFLAAGITASLVVLIAEIVHFYVSQMMTLLK